MTGDDEKQEPGERRNQQHLDETRDMGRSRQVLTEFLATTGCDPGTAILTATKETDETIKAKTMKVLNDTSACRWKL